MSNWSADFELARQITSHDGQILVEAMSGYYQVVTWDAATEKWRENTNQLALRQRPLRWKLID